MEMYVRRKPNRSGSTSVVVVDKSRGKLRYLTTIGTSSDEGELSRLYQQGKIQQISVAHTHRILGSHRDTDN